MTDSNADSADSVEDSISSALAARTTRADGSLFLPPSGAHGSHAHIEDRVWTVISEDPPIGLCEYRSVADTRERLDVTNPGDFFDWMSENLGASATLPGLFRRNGRLVRVPRIGEEGWIERPAGEGDDGPAQVRELTDTGLMGIIQTKYWVCREKEEVKPDDKSSTGEKKIIYRTHAVVPKDMCRIPVDGPDEFASLPLIAGITHTPMLRGDGSLLSDPGHDGDTRGKSNLLYMPADGFELVRGFDPVRVPYEWLVWSQDVLNGLLWDFPFVHPLHKMNYLALLLTPLMRAKTPPPYPMFVIEAYMRGTGKSLLAKVAREIHGGIHRPELPTDGDEIRKQITSILTTTTPPIVNFDNIMSKIQNGQIANLLTTAVWSDRPLGRTGTVEAVNDRLWVVTGNQVDIGGDLERRVRHVRIDAVSEHPEYRIPDGGFQHPDLIGYVKQARSTLVTALLTQIMWWVGRGMPVKEGLRADDYAYWEGCIAEILEGGGLDPDGHFAAGERALPDGAVLSSDEDEWADLLSVLVEQFGGSEFQVKDVEDWASSVTGAAIMTEAWPSDCVVGRDGNKWRVLSHYLKKHVKQPGGGHRLVILPAKRRRALVYQIEKMAS